MELLEKILTGAVTLALFAWIWVRSQARSDNLEKRVAEIEKTGMTREEFVREMAVVNQTRQNMHAENQAGIKEIRDDIKENEKRRSHTEHAILDIVHELKMKHAATEAVEKYKDTRNDR